MHILSQRKTLRLGWVQGYIYLALQFQGNGQQDSTFKIYIATNINNHGSDQEEYALDEETNRNQSQQWKEESLVAELFHVAKTLVH
jgi:hypothetical protein